MAVRKRYMRALAPVAVTALVLSACAGGGEVGDDQPPAETPAETGDDTGDGDATGEPGGDGERGEAGGSFSIHNCEPQNLLVGNSSEVCGSKILEQLYTGLTAVDYDTSEAIPGVATSWDSEDAVTWTFTLSEDFTFHNGDPVTAQTFVDTWNWVVNPDNAQGNESFHSKFVGYDEVSSGEATEMSGVRAVDDYTLEIELVEPFSPLPVMLSYTGFYPLPDEAFDDIDGFQNSPIGNGRYQMDGDWERGVEINMTRYEDWPGENPGLADEINWRIYSDLNTAYLDVQAGNLDILSGIPPENIATVDNDGFAGVVESPSSSFTYLGFPLYVEEFQDADVRHALSMAIDRQTIIDQIFNGALSPASSAIPPVLAQYRDDACQYCDFDPEAAAEMYEAAGGPSSLTIWYNSGAGHENWTEAVANMWQQNLPIDSITFESLEFAQYLDLHEREEVTGPFRLGWVLSYPSPQYALEPIYSTGVSSNYTTFSNEEFDSLIAQANGETDPATADGLYQQAEDILLEEMPIIPMWYGLTHTVHTDNVDGIEVDPRTFVRVENISVNNQ